MTDPHAVDVTIIKRGIFDSGRAPNMFDLSKPIDMLFRLFRNFEPGSLKEFAELITHLPSEFSAEFFSQLFKPAYVPVSGTTQHVAKLRFTLPKRADELLAALRACQVDKS